MPEGFRAHEATGLGLQLVRALVMEQHCGYFTLTPERGGSKARVNLRLGGPYVRPRYEEMTGEPSTA